MIRTLHRTVSVLALAVAARTATAQTDFYNLDAGRPLRIEDALVVERHAFEWQLAPLRFAGVGGRRTAIGIEPELAWGVLPRTQLEVGMPLEFPRGGGVGAGGVEISALHALNAETLGWPGLAVRVGAHVPAGPHGPRTVQGEVAALATRTISRTRLHGNVAIASGDAPDAVRWSAGLAIDRTFPIRSLLIGAELVAEDPVATAALRWSTALGLRRQVGPRTAVDLGMGRVLTGERREWFVTMGSAVSFGLLHRFGGVR